MRPNTSDIDKLDKLICIRLSEMEKKLLLKRCHQEGYLTLSDFCRAKLVKRREIRKIEVSREFVRVTQKLDYELNKIGVNLNQVARQINTQTIYQFTGSDRALFRKLLLELQDCFGLLQKYLDQIEKSD